MLTEKGKVVLASQACRSVTTFQEPQNPSAALVFNLQWRVHPYFWLSCLWSLLKQQAVITKRGRNSSFATQLSWGEKGKIWQHYWRTLNLPRLCAPVDLNSSVPSIPPTLTTKDFCMSPSIFLHGMLSRQMGWTETWATSPCWLMHSCACCGDQKCQALLLPDEQGGWAADISLACSSTAV